MKKTTNLFNTLEYFMFLSKSMQDSGTQILSKIDSRFVYLKRDQDDDDDPFPRRRRDVISETEQSEIIEKLGQFADYLQTTPLQAAIIIAMYTTQLEDCSGSESECFSRFFQTSTVESIPMKGEYEILQNKGYFKAMSGGYRSRRRSCYVLDKQLEHAIVNNKPFSLSQAKEVDRYKFCQMVSDEIEKRRDGECSTVDLFNSVERLEDNNESIKFVQLVKKRIKQLPDRVLFYEMCDDYICYGESGLESTLSDIYDDVSKRFKVASLLMSENHALFKSKWIEKKPASFLSKSGLLLTQKGMEIFLEKDYTVVKDTKKEDKRLIAPDKIDAKQLFFSPKLTEEINFLQESLEDSQFKDLQNRLKEKSMPKGLTAIFYGLPGTGKTETVMQLAKATGRKVIHVDISASKTCWYGESEKLVKRIFTDYADKCKSEKLKPILLFNEADAILGKRREDVSRSTDQTDNAIQNILLEEMEKLDGIMIATTNLVDNLDDAFERRFLFKIKFDKPTAEAKKNIWKSKMPALSDADCEKLALQFDFSGGEIDNIVRKFTMQEVLKKAVADYDAIAKLCGSEKINRKGGHKKVGFN